MQGVRACACAGGRLRVRAGVCACVRRGRARTYARVYEARSVYWEFLGVLVWGVLRKIWRGFFVCACVLCARAPVGTRVCVLVGGCVVVCVIVCVCVCVRVCVCVLYQARSL